MSATIATVAPAPAPCGKALVQDPLRSGVVRDPARDRGRLAVAQSCDQRLDQGARRRLHQADQDGDRADHLLHRRLRHFAYPGRPQGRPRRHQGAALFRDRLVLRADHRPGDGQFDPGRPRARRKAGRRRRRQLRQAGRGAEVGRFRPQHHSRQRGRRVRARRHPAGAAVRDPVRLRADGARRARPPAARHHRRRLACGVRRDRAS